MNEEYVSLKVAKLLNEKGFDINTGTFYGNDGCFYHYIRKEFGLLPAPPLHIAQKWMREEKDIHIMIDVCASGYYAALWKTNRTFIKTLVDKGPNDGGVWDSYKEALQVGILETLKLSKGQRGECADIGTFSPNGYDIQYTEKQNHLLETIIGNSD